MDETDEGSLPGPEASFSELDHAMMRLAMRSCMVRCRWAPCW